MRWVNGEIKMDTHANLIGEKFPQFSLKDSEKKPSISTTYSDVGQ